VDDDFFEARVSRASNLVFVSEKIDPLGFFVSFLSSVSSGGWRIFFASGEERNEFAFFSQKIVKKDSRERRARETVMKRERTEEKKKVRY
jgi:hypothetical protein